MKRIVLSWLVVGLFVSSLLVVLGPPLQRFVAGAPEATQVPETGQGLLQRFAEQLARGAEKEKLQRQSGPLETQVAQRAPRGYEHVTASRLGEVCDEVKAGYKQENVRLHRMDNYWRCLIAQAITVDPDGSYGIVPTVRP